LIALAFVLLTAAACGRDDAGGDGDTGSSGGGELASVPGFDGKRFEVGLLAVTSGPAAAGSAPGVDGFRTYVEALNAKGGIAGKYPVDLLLRDTQNDPAKAVQAYNATKNDVAMYGYIFGTPLAKAVLPQLKSDGLLAIPGADGTFLHEPNLVLGFTPYESQLIEVLDYVGNNRDGKDKTVCAAGGEGALADSVGAVLTYVRDEMGYKIGPRVSLSATSTNYTPQIQQLRRAGCQIVLLLASPVPTVSGVLSSAAKLDFTAQWVTPNVGFVAAMKESPVMGYMEEHLLVASDGTLYGDTENAPGMSALMAAHDRYAKDVLPEWGYVAGWGNATRVDQILTKAVALGDVSREGIIKASAAIDQFELGGIQFSPRWGDPAEREVADKYSVLEPDRSSDIGARMLEYGIPAPAAAVEYPYENAAE
jgi:ABC-type branched-subunit amino acid transport system substrate-binding protein